MSSKNILLHNTIQKPKVTPNIHKEVLEEYFKNNYETIKNIKFNKNIITKIIYLNYTFKNTKLLSQIKNKIKWVYKKLFLPFTNDITEKIYNIDNCNETIDSFFSLQHKFKNTNEIISLIIYQYVFIKNVQNYLFILSDKDNYYIHSEIYVNEDKLNVDKYLINFVHNYLNSYDIIYKPKNNTKKENILEEYDKQILVFLEKVTQNIIKKIQKINQKYFDIISYGSYTSYVLNKNVKYNDIDIYHSNPLKFLIIIMMAIKFILNINVDIFKIPFILGHLSLRYKNVHFVDCIYMDKYTMSKIPTCIIKNIIFVDPIVQMLNNFRMMSVIQRMHGISLDKENTSLKYITLLNYSKKHMGLDFNFKKKIDFDIKIINDDFFLIDLKKIFKEKPNYNYYKHLLSFDYLIISLCKPKYFLKLIDRDDIIISKQYFALFNEIVVEFLNKDKNEIQKTSSKKDLNQAVDIHESQLNYQDDPKTEKFPIILEKIIENNNVLLMTNISTDIYIKNYLSAEKTITNVSVTNISKETILCSFVLYNTIKYKTSEIIKFYIEILFNFIKFNNKIPEFKLLANIKNNDLTSYNNIYIQKKIKLSGDHLIFKLEDHMYIKNLFFYKNQDQEYYNYKSFLEVTNYNID